MLPNLRTMMAGGSPSRRSLLRRGGAWAGAIVGAGIAAPLLFDTEHVIQIVTAQTQRLGIRTRPRYRRRQHRLFIRVGVDPGWYANQQPRQKVDAFYVAHFVRPEFAFVRKGMAAKKRKHIAKSTRRPLETPVRERPKVKRPEKTIVRVYRTVRGAGKIKPEKFQKLRKLKPDELPILSRAPLTHTVAGQKRQSRLNRSFYSEGIEFEVIDAWRKSNQELALRLLDKGMTYVENGGFDNVRLCDLYAGLLVRAEKKEDLNRLVQKIKKFTEALAGRRSNKNVHLARLESRLTRWQKADGNWYQSWLPNRRRRWNGIDLDSSAT